MPSAMSSTTGLATGSAVVSRNVSLCYVVSNQNKKAE